MRLIPAAVEYVVPINAFVMAMLAAFLIHMLSVKRGVSVETIVLLGIALVFTFNALLALVQFFTSAETLAAVVFWSMGSLTKAAQACCHYFHSPGCPAHSRAARLGADCAEAR
ncbi:hypothetical protein MesoLjLb_14240 [Mesorhizobium sp. L-8-3]|nr:hypothetical protein MesoLjLb_14240 [Mesorhizobium sp. L-8-3]